MKDFCSELDDVMVRLRRHMMAKPVNHSIAHMAESHIVLMRKLVASDGLRMNEIATLLAVKPPAVSAIIDHLEKVKVVERVADPTDRRATIIRLTDFGRSKWADIDKDRKVQMRKYLAVLDENDQKDLLRICNKLLGALEKSDSKESKDE